MEELRAEVLSRPPPAAGHSKLGRAAEQARSPQLVLLPQEGHTNTRGFLSVTALTGISSQGPDPLLLSPKIFVGLPTLLLTSCIWLSPTQLKR